MASPRFEDPDIDNIEDVVDLTAVDSAPGDNPALDWQANDPLPDPVNIDDNDETPEFPTVENLVLNRPQSSLTKKKKMIKLPKKLRVTFDEDSTAYLMEQFLYHHRQKAFNSSKRKDYGPVWRACASAMKERFPTEPWTVEAISNKYDTEKKRFRALKTLLAKTGVTLDPETSIPQAPDSVWEDFFARHETPRRRLGWMRERPIGKISTYEEVFHRESATGTRIREAGDDEPSDTDEPDESGDDTTPGPGRRSAAAESIRKRRREVDPDENQEISEDFGDVSLISTSDTPSKRTRRGDTLSDEGLQAAAARLLEARPPGGHDINWAFHDFITNYGSSMSSKEVLKCMRYLKDPVEALMWRNLTPALKEEQLKEWK